MLLILKNKAKEQVISQKVILCKSFFSRLKGLLGRKKFSEGEALILTHTSRVHSFFMQFAIDLIFLDKNKKVLATEINFLQNKISPQVENSYYVIELPANYLQKIKIDIGDSLDW